MTHLQLNISRIIHESMPASALKNLHAKAAHLFGADARETMLPPFVLMTDATRQGNVASLIAALPSPSLVIIRDYDHPQRAAYAAKLIMQARNYSHGVLVAGDWKLAQELNADGVHLPEHAVGAAHTIQSHWKNAVITAAAHSRPALQAAEKAKVDAAFLSPVFATGSHHGVQPLGISRAALMVQGLSVPVYALGGITAQTITRLSGLPFRGVAVVGQWASEPLSEPQA